MRQAFRGIWVCSLVVAAGCLTGYLIVRLQLVRPRAPVIIKTLTGTFTDTTQNDQISLLAPSTRDLRKNYIMIFRMRGNVKTLIWRSPKTPTWDIQLADVDGDGRNELALCLYKTEKHDPKKDNRLQIYAWGRNGIYAKWRGTFLCYPFQKLTFGDLDQDGKAELISLEHNQRQQILSVYTWNGFGFDLLSQTGIRSPVASVECEGSQIRLRAKTGTKILKYRWENASLKAWEG